MTLHVLARVLLSMPSGDSKHNHRIARAGMRSRVMIMLTQKSKA